MRIPTGVSDQYIYFVAVDITDLKTRETGLSGFTVYRSRNGGAAAIYTTPTINETDSTNMPGVYELLLDEDVTLDAGDQSQEICLHITHASMSPVTRVIELYRPSVTDGERVTVSGGAITTVTTTGTATNVTTVNGLAANVITAASMNADASAEIADAVWDEDATAHQTGGTFGQAIGDPGADTNTIFKAVVTDATGATVGVDVAAVLADTGTDGVVVASINANAITAAAINADAITAAKVADDVSTEIANKVWDTDCTARQTQGTFGQAIGDPGADTNTLFKAVVTDATGATVGVDVVALKAETVNILADTAEIGAAGAGLTAINLPDQTMNITGDITGSLSGSVGSVTGAVGSVTAGVTVTTNNDKTGYALSAAGVDAIWDEPLTSATHDVDQSAGARLRGLDVISGSVNDAGATSSAFVTDLGSAVDNFYADMVLRFTSGALKDVTRPIYSYAQATKTVTFDEALPSAPANGVTFDIIAEHVHNLTTVGTYAGNATWDTDATAHQTQGTFGQAIGDPAADTNTIYKGVVTDAAGATVGVDVVAVKADTAAVKVQTDKFVFTVANQVDANIQYVNDVLVTGNGAPGTEWGP